MGPRFRSVSYSKKKKKTENPKHSDDFEKMRQYNIYLHCSNFYLRVIIPLIFMRFILSQKEYRLF